MNATILILNMFRIKRVQIRIETTDAGPKKRSKHNRRIIMNDESMGSLHWATRYATKGMYWNDFSHTIKASFTNYINEIKLFELYWWHSVLVLNTIVLRKRRRSCNICSLYTKYMIEISVFRKLKCYKKCVSFILLHNLTLKEAY